MKQGTELSDLIKSLTASEKRYFRLSAGLQKGSKIYLTLFNIIDSQKIHDEEKVREQFNKKASGRNLSFTKNYLYKMIFKSLMNIYNENSTDAKLGNIIGRSRIMYEKALFPQYFKHLTSGRELAKKYERFTRVIDFLETERQLSKKEDLIKKSTDDNYNEEVFYLKKIENNNIYKRAVSSLLEIRRTEGVLRNPATEKKIKEIFSIPELREESNAISVTAKEKFYFANMLASEIAGDDVKAYEFSKKRFGLISNNREIFRQFLFNNYKDALGDFILSAAEAGKKPEAEKLYQKYKREFPEGKTESIEQNCLHYKIMLITNDIENDVLKKKELYESAEKFLLKNKGKITVDNFNIIYYRLSEGNFKSKNYDEALRLINRLFSNKTLKYVSYLEQYARMLNLMIHFESGNYRMVSYLIESITKYLKYRKKLYRTEASVLKLINELLKTISEEDKVRKIKKFAVTVSEYQADKYEKNAFKYFDYREWAEDKIKRAKI